MANREDLSRIQDALSQDQQRILGLANALGGMATPTELITCLEELHDLLREHFHREELPDGYYKTMGACAVEYRSELRTLMDDHYLLLSAVHGLLRWSREAEDISADIHGGIDAFVVRLMGHEHREAAILTKLLKQV